jgi:amidase
MDDIAGLDATAQAELVRSGEVSPGELVDGAIARIEKLNPELNAVIWPLFERARAEAAGDLPDGPFRGVPFLLKDFAAELEGTPFAEGSDLAGDHVSTGSQELTLRFQRAGFVVCGKTNTPELGILPTTEPRRFGPTRNPWDTSRTTGGSSGGSAAAVASGMVPIAHANDGGGSIRIPASCCGLFGLKPTRGRVTLAPRYGDLMGGLVAEHVVSRSVRDSAAVLDCTSGPTPGDPYWAPPPSRPFADEVGSDPGRMRIGVTTASPTGAAVEPACSRAVDAAAALCEELGHEVEQLSFPAIDGNAFTEHFITMWAAGNAWALLDWEERIGRAATEDDVEPLTWALASMGRVTTADRYLKAVQELQRASRTLATFFEGIDVLLTPTLGEPPTPLGTFDSPADNPLQGLFRAAAFVPFTPIFNVTGQPAASIPLHWDESGLPIGVQAAASFGDEASIFRLASQLEVAAPWADRRPPVFAAG